MAEAGSAHTVVLNDRLAVLATDPRRMSIWFVASSCRMLSHRCQRTRSCAARHTARGTHARLTQPPMRSEDAARRVPATACRVVAFSRVVLLNVWPMAKPRWKHGAERGLSNHVAAEMMMMMKVKDRRCQRYHVGLVSRAAAAACPLQHVQRDVTTFHSHRTCPNTSEPGPNTTECVRSYTTDCPTLTPLYRYVQSDSIPPPKPLLPHSLPQSCNRTHPCEHPPSPPTSHPAALWP